MRRSIVVSMALFSLNLITGCGNQSFANALNRLIDAVGDIQTRPQALPPVLVQQGDTILIDASVTIINNPAQDIDIIELPNQTVLGFENDTGLDIFIQYFADDELQGVFVFDGEALLLNYPCLSVIELISEDDVDPVTGVLVDSFDLTGNDFFNPDDFICGDAFIVNFDPFSVNVRTEVIDLLP